MLSPQGLCTDCSLQNPLPQISIWLNPPPHLSSLCSNLPFPGDLATASYLLLHTALHLSLVTLHVSYLALPFLFFSIVLVTL